MLDAVLHGGGVVNGLTVVHNTAEEMLMGAVDVVWCIGIMEG